MKALLVNGLGRGFDLEDVEIALPKGRMNLDDLVSKRIALGEVNAGYAALKEGSLNRVVTSF
jgi:Zn-dependent alcohol dehydrogenase